MSRTDVLQGTMDLLILKTLAQVDEMHGFGVAVHIQRVSEETLRVEEGSLYPALHRIQQNGWITSEWRQSENNRRAKYYRLTAAGRKQLKAEEVSWQRLVRGVDAVLRFA
jgi:PadR family transcriptional regulator PadR